MAEIFKFPEKQLTADQLKLQRQQLAEAVYNKVVDDIGVMWQEYEIKNKLNSFIVSRIPSSLINFKVDYTKDLNAISEIEIYLQMNRVMSFPLNDRIRYYQSGFRFEDKIFFSTGNLLKTLDEARTRICNVIVYIEFITRIHQTDSDIK